MNQQGLKRPGRRIIVLLTALLAVYLPNIVIAGKDKFTSAPTRSWWPTVAPTTLSPTAEPTLTAKPSSVRGPSLNPSVAPFSIAPVPTFVSTPPPANPTVAVGMPKLTFVMQTNGVLDDNEIKSALVDFLSDYLSQGIYKSSFRFLDLTTIAIQENNEASVFTNGGEAHFDAAQLVPSVEDLANVLITYFSFWGDQNLRDYLIAKQFPVESVSEVLVNGEQLESSTGDLTPSSDEVSKSSSSNESDQFNAFAVAGIVIGGLVVIVTIALFVHTRRRQNRSLEGNNDEVVVVKPISDDEMEDEIKGLNDTFPSEDSNENQDPDVVTVDQSSPVDNGKGVNPDPENTSDDLPTSELPLQIRVTEPVPDDEYNGNDGGAYSSDGDIISVTESLMYRELDKHGPLFNVKSMGTSMVANKSSPVTDMQSAAAMPRGASARPVHNSVFQYDASRLDQVISQAKSTKDEK